MGQAEELFKTLESLAANFQKPQSPTTAIVDYCKNVLGATERLHFDFKRKEEHQHPHLDGKDKRNLAKAVSGFANSGGGVLHWGIHD